MRRSAGSASRDVAGQHTRWPQPAPMLSDHLPQSEGRGLKNPAFGRSSAVRHPPHVPEFPGGRRTQASPSPVPADPAASDARKGSTTSRQSAFFFSNTETKAAGLRANPFSSCVGRASSTPRTNQTPAWDAHRFPPRTSRDRHTTAKASESGADGALGAAHPGGSAAAEPRARERTERGSKCDTTPDA